MCAKPRAAPPPSANPKRGGRSGAGAGGTAAGVGGCSMRSVPQPVSASNIPAAAARRVRPLQAGWSAAFDGFAMEGFGGCGGCGCVSVKREVMGCKRLPVGILAGFLSHN